jgi:hypothetical protein
MKSSPKPTQSELESLTDFYESVRVPDTRTKEQMLAVEHCKIIKDIDTRYNKELSDILGAPAYTQKP